MADTISEIVCEFCGATTHTFFTEKDGHRLYRCTGCGHGVVWPLPGDTTEVYGKDYFAGADDGFGYTNYDQDKEPVRPLLERALSRAEALLADTSSRRVIDVGAATGFFLDIARGRKWEVAGVELSDFAAQVAREKGIAVTTGTLQTASMAPASVDLVTYWDVIEHVQSPVEELRTAVRILRPGGLLMMITPNWDSFYARLLGKRWHAIVPPEHLQYFTYKSMRKLLASAGLTEIEISSPSKSFTLSYVFQILYRWQGLRVWRGIAEFLKRHPRLAGVSVPIPLHDNMLVIARKL